MAGNVGIRLLYPVECRADSPSPSPLPYRRRPFPRARARVWSVTFVTFGTGGTTLPPYSRACASYPASRAGELYSFATPTT